MFKEMNKNGLSEISEGGFAANLLWSIGGYVGGKVLDRYFTWYGT